MCRRGMTSYIGAAWRLKRAAMSISTMGAMLPFRFGRRIHPESARWRVKPAERGSYRYNNTGNFQPANFS
jgi:hypothetical protein